MQLFSGSRAEYLTPGRSVFASYGFHWRGKIPDVGVDSILFAGYEVGSGPTEVRVRLMISGGSSSGSVQMWMRMGGFAFQILKQSVGGVVTANTLVSIDVTFNAAAPMHMYIDGVEPAYATNVEQAGLRPQLNAAWYLGGDHTGPVGEMELAEFACWDGNNIVENSRYRAAMLAGWSPRFYGDVLEGSTNRPGLIFHVQGTNQQGDLIETMNGFYPTMTGAALTWTDHPLLLEPAAPFLESESVLPPVIECPPALANVLLGDYNQGNVRQTFAGDEDDDGEDILWTVLTRPAFVGTPQERAYYRRLILKVTDVDADQAILVRTIFGPVVTGTPRIIETELTTPSFVGLGLGNLLYNSEADMHMGLGLIATNVRAILAGFGKIRIRGLEYHLRGKPLTKPSTYA